MHDALRRDLERTRHALTAAKAPDHRRRVAIAEHLNWMMNFLRAHHRGEDHGLWPLVRERNPDAVALLTQMDADHQQVTPAINAVESAAASYRESAHEQSRLTLLRALESLDSVLLPHLRHEEEEAMPVVSASISEQDWRSWDHATNIKNKSPSQLGEEGHWLLDALDPVRRDLVTHLVPPIPRFVLVHAFGRRYRRHAAIRWGTGQAGIRPHHRPAAGRLDTST